jgi:hypothetical protein
MTFVLKRFGMAFRSGRSLSRPMAFTSPAATPKPVGLMIGVLGIIRAGKRVFSAVRERRCVASGVGGKAGICGC